MYHTSDRFRPASEVVFTRVSEADGILLSLATKRYYSLNETGMRIWEALERGESLSATAEALVVEYDVTSDEAATLVVEFVQSLRSEGLVGAAANPGSGPGGGPEQDEDPASSAYRPLRAGEQEREGDGDR